MGLVDDQDRFLADVARLVIHARDMGFVVTGGELFRTPQQQALHLRAGRSRSMDSQHLRRLAIDLNFFVRRGDRLSLCVDREALKPLGEFWEALTPGANRWGGNWQSFKDTPHFERRSREIPLPVAPDRPAETLDVRADMRTAATAPAAAPAAPQSSAPAAPIGLLSAAVGHRAPNRKDDVKTVQVLLNRWRQAGGATTVRQPELLAEDGRLGPRTQAAIFDLQRSLGMAAPDGVVDPDGPSFRHLAAGLEPVFSAGLLALALPAANPDDVARFAPGIAACFQRHGLTTPLRQAHFLAQIGHESGSLRHVEEIASGTAYEGRTDLGNTRPGDGPRFKGRGLIQLTGRANYTRFGEAIGRKAEILANPALVASDPALAVEAAGWFWSDRKLNAPADRDDLRLITRRINGGLNGLAQRQALFDRIRALYRLD